jgi:hypothetical protein
MAAATTSVNGYLTSADWTTFNNKQPAGSYLVSGGALGTPSSGTATNLTGTAAGLTAGNVTTNANLTGPITSVGNATSIASQTGTGSKFVVDTSPTLVTPNIGVATATSLTFGGTTFSNYNEGTWSPSVSSVTNFTGTPTVSSGKYVRIGKMCTVQAIVSGTVTTPVTTTFINLASLPFNRSAASDPGAGIAVSITAQKIGRMGNDGSDATSIFMLFPSTSAQPSGADSFQISFTYVTA